MMPIKTLKNWTDCIIFCYKKNLEISFQNGPEHETISLKSLRTQKKMQKVLSFIVK